MIIMVLNAAGFSMEPSFIEDPADTSTLSYFQIIMKKLSAFDPIQDAALPTLKTCRKVVIPLKAILLESEETTIINSIEVHHRRMGFLPFYTKFWCTGIRLSIEILADVLYSRRDCQKHHCNTFDENHLIRTVRFRDNTSRLLKRSQELFENEVLLRQKSFAQWTEFALDGSIMFLESLYEE